MINYAKVTGLIEVALSIDEGGVNPKINKVYEEGVELEITQNVEKDVFIVFYYRSLLDHRTHKRFRLICNNPAKES